MTDYMFKTYEEIGIGEYFFGVGSLGFAPDPKYLYPTAHIGDGTAGTLRASTLHSGAGAPGVDLAASILKNTIVVDDVTGNYTGGAGTVVVTITNKPTITRQ